MHKDWKKRLLFGGFALSLTLGGLAGCGDGVDQDNGISDGQQKDAIDNDTKKDTQDTGQKTKKELQSNGINDGVDQDNGVSDGEKKDEIDN